MGDLFHIGVILANMMTGQPVFQLDMTSKTGISTFQDIKACEAQENDEAFQLALEDLRTMMMGRLKMPLSAFTKCLPGPPQDRIEAEI